MRISTVKITKKVLKKENEKKLENLNNNVLNTVKHCIKKVLKNILKAQKHLCTKFKVDNLFFRSFTKLRKFCQLSSSVLKFKSENMFLKVMENTGLYTNIIILIYLLHKV